MELGAYAICLVGLYVPDWCGGSNRQRWRWPPRRSSPRIARG